MSCADVDIDQRQKGNKTHSIVHVRRRCFPDGAPWTEQEAFVAETFSVIANEIREAVRRG